MIKPNFLIKADKVTANYGLFIIEPLQQGYGQTLGNALRRVLLNSLPGAAITSVRIDGIKHVFSTVKGLKEDVVELSLNLKQVRFVCVSDKAEKVTLNISGPKEIKAKDLDCPSGVKVANPDLILGHLTDKASKLKLELVIESGYGYVAVEEREANEEIGVIPLDAVFSPVKRVNYLVGATRVGRITNFDKLSLEIWTDGTISPREALDSAATTLTAFFDQIINPKIVKDETVSAQPVKNDNLTLTVEELELPTRIVNSLLKVGIKDITDLQSTGKKKLSKIKNLGGKSLKVVEAALIEKNIILED